MSEAPVESPIYVSTLLPGPPPQRILLARVKSFVDRLLWDREAHPELELYRLKGLLHVGGASKKHVLQAVYELYSINETVDWNVEETRK